jgi:hypothetical protein
MRQTFRGPDQIPDDDDDDDDDDDGRDGPRNVGFRHLMRLIVREDLTEGLEIFNPTSTPSKVCYNDSSITMKPKHFALLPYRQLPISWNIILKNVTYL